MAQRASAISNPNSVSRSQPRRDSKRWPAFCYTGWAKSRTPASHWSIRGGALLCCRWTATGLCACGSRNCPSKPHRVRIGSGRTPRPLPFCMLGIDNRAARYTWTVAVVTVLLLLVYLIRSTLFVFILALLFAYLLSPLVNVLYRALPAHWTRTPALALAYIIFVGLVILIGAEIGSRVVDEANTLAKKLPDMLAGLQKPSPTAPAAVNSLKAQIVERIRVQIEERTGDLVAAISK